MPIQRKTQTYCLTHEITNATLRWMMRQTTNMLNYASNDQRRYTVSNDASNDQCYCTLWHFEWSVNWPNRHTTRWMLRQLPSYTIQYVEWRVKWPRPEYNTSNDASADQLPCTSQFRITHQCTATVLHGDWCFKWQKKTPVLLALNDAPNDQSQCTSRCMVRQMTNPTAHNVVWCAEWPILLHITLYDAPNDQSYCT